MEPVSVTDRREQSGKVVKIEGDRVKLFNPDGFGGAYLRYAKETWEDADRCWIED